MLPTAGYFKTIPCPFFLEDLSCSRPFCHFKHDRNELRSKPESSRNTEKSKSKEKPSNYTPTPLAELEKKTSSSVSYVPTPIEKIEADKKEKEKKAKHDIISSILEESQHEASFDSDKSRKEKSKSHKSDHSKSKSHKSKSSEKSSDSKRDSRRESKSSSSGSRKDSKSSERKKESDSKRRSSDDKKDSKSSHKRHSSKDDKKEQPSNKKPKTNGESEVPDSVLSFLEAMDEIDKNLERSGSKSPTKKVVKEDNSFLSELSKPDKALVKEKEIDPRQKRIRISSVQPDESGMSSAMIARRKQPNNPVRAMLNRFNKARIESQTKDLEDQLCLITGEEPTPSTSKSQGMELPEGLRKGKTSRVAHTVQNKSTLRRPVIDSESVGKVPTNIRQKYLDTIVDECLKIFPNNVAAAYERAEKEEKICCEKSKTRSIYLNSVVNCIKRLRDEAKEVSGGASKRAPNVPKSITPNMLTTHLQTLVGKAGTRGSWSIEHNVKNVPDMTSEMFYKFLMRYVLTDEQLEENGYPTPDNLTKALDEGKFDLLDRQCDRCQKNYRVNVDGMQIVKQECVFHWARLRRQRGNRATGLLNIYPCCNGDAQSDGCSVNPCHVTKEVDPRGFVKTISSEDKSKQRVYALDCEMCYTSKGIELTRVTVVDEDGNSAYESFVKPDNPILDYNTRFSGITENDLKNVTTTIRDVQAILLSMFSSETILCGHSLDSDLKALKLIHHCVVDTSVTFPHKLGAPYKRALRNLTSEYLQRIIQEDVGGHDSKEDALAALDLMKYKVKEDLKKL